MPDVNEVSPRLGRYIVGRPQNLPANLEPMNMDELSDRFQFLEDVELLDEVGSPEKPTI